MKGIAESSEDCRSMCITVALYCVRLVVGYKTHTDCVEDNADERDRMATVLVYLQNVEDGGETKFPGRRAQHVNCSLNIHDLTCIIMFVRLL